MGLARKIYRILRPRHWIKSDPYNAVWDRFVLDCIEQQDVLIKNQHVALAGGKEVWISNYPYSFGTSRNGFAVRPSAKTIDLLRDHLVWLSIQSDATQ